MYHVYFLKSARHGKYYTGSTNKEPEERLWEHNHGSNKWTKENGPFIMVYFESYICKEDAIRREKFYKSGFGREIRNCIFRAVAKFPPQVGLAEARTDLI